MIMQKTVREDIVAVKFTAKEDGVVAGRASLYVIYNDLHVEPYGLLEDVFVEEAFRHKGVGTDLVKSVIAEAAERKCRKIVATSRMSRPEVHAWYKKMGFEQYGYAFKLEL